MIVIAKAIVVLLGIVVLMMCLWGLVSPDRLVRTVRGVMDKSWGMAFAVAVRIILGVALLLAAPDSAYPLAFTTLGWLALIAAMAIPIVGRQRLASLMNWFAGASAAMIRTWLLFGVLFGGFVLYGMLGAAALA